MDVAVEYFRTCITTLKREWSGIDRLRLDKFMLMIRHFVKCAMAYCAVYEWKTKVVMAFTAVLGKDCLFNNDHPTSIGVLLQVAHLLFKKLLGFVRDVICLQSKFEVDGLYGFVTHFSTGKSVMKLDIKRILDSTAFIDLWLLKGARKCVM